MTITLSMPELTELKPRITVIGVGGAGGNAVNNMIKANLLGVEFVVANTDAQALLHSKAEKRIQLGARLTQGLGAGARPEVGRAAAEESLDQVLEYINGSHMVFITAGMGGGTGTGAAPVIARAAREMGLLTVGVVTKPFQFEGSKRMRLAEEGIAEMQKVVDTLIIIPNQNLFRIATEKTTFADAFAMADEVLHSGVRGVTDLMVMPGLVNLDFADVRTVMSEMGKAMMGTGEAEGENRALEAAEAAISNPLLDEVSMKGAKGVLINITGGMDLTLFEVDEAANRIRAEVDPDANILVGSALDESLNGRMRVSVVATGIEASDNAQLRPESLIQTAVERTARIETITTRPAAVAASVEAEEAAEPAAFAEEEAPAEHVAEVAAETAEDEVYVEEGAAEPQVAAFVPPAPMEPSQPVIEIHGQREPEPFAEAALANGPAPERKPAPVKQKESLSWFERMTGRGRRAQAQAQERTAPDLFERKAPAMRSEPEKAAAPQPVHAPQPAPSKAPSLARVSADDRMSANRKLDEQLEIPTFLRRQAN